MNPKTKEKLLHVSTATLCTALFKRGLRNQFIQDVRPLNPALPNMVGEAFTLRYIPAREDLNPISAFQNRDHPQRKAVEECPAGAVFVIDSRKDARAASAGSILVSRLMKRGVAGVVTDGGFRDSPEIARLPYTSMKSAVATFTKGIARAYGKHGVRANCVAPGAIETSALTEIRRQVSEAKGIPYGEALERVMVDEWHLDVALQRPGRPEEVGALIAFLLSPVAGYMTGALLNIDGGTGF